MTLSTQTRGRIEKLVTGHPVLLFMKGRRGAPQCGFSATVVGLLDKYLDAYETVDVLEDPEIREGVKEFSQWPTIPQLYVKGEFVGGCDIIRQLDEDGELLTSLGDVATTPEPPELTITPKAAEVFGEAMTEAEGDEGLRLIIDAGFGHDLILSPPAAGDVEVTAGGLVFRLDPASARRARGLRIDYVEAPQTGFKMDNPNAPPSVAMISVQDLDAMMSDGKPLRILDVRTPQERSLASLDAATLVTEDNIDELLELPRDTRLAMLCHHGIRSHQLAMRFLQAGFSSVHNVVGGIDAWSKEIDPSVPQY